jgi:hypothetical protein
MSVPPISPVTQKLLGSPTMQQRVLSLARERLNSNETALQAFYAGERVRGKTHEELTHLLPDIKSKPEIDKLDIAIKSVEGLLTHGLTPQGAKEHMESQRGIPLEISSEQVNEIDKRLNSHLQAQALDDHSQSIRGFLLKVITDLEKERAKPKELRDPNNQDKKIDVTDVRNALPDLPLEFTDARIRRIRNQYFEDRKAFKPQFDDLQGKHAFALDLLRRSNEDEENLRRDFPHLFLSEGVVSKSGLSSAAETASQASQSPEEVRALTEGSQASTKSKKRPNPFETSIESSSAQPTDRLTVPIHQPKRQRLNQPGAKSTTSSVGSVDLSPPSSDPTFLNPQAITVSQQGWETLYGVLPNQPGTGSVSSANFSTVSQREATTPPVFSDISQHQTSLPPHNVALSDETQPTVKRSHPDIIKLERDRAKNSFFANKYKEAGEGSDDLKETFKSLQGNGKKKERARAKLRAERYLNRRRGNNPEKIAQEEATLAQKLQRYDLKLAQHGIQPELTHSQSGPTLVSATTLLPFTDPTPHTYNPQGIGFSAPHIPARIFTSPVPPELIVTLPPDSHPHQPFVFQGINALNVQTNTDSLEDLEKQLTNKKRGKTNATNLFWSQKYTNAQGSGSDSEGLKSSITGPSEEARRVKRHKLRAERYLSSQRDLTTIAQDQADLGNHLALRNAEIEQLKGRIALLKSGNSQGEVTLIGTTPSIQTSPALVPTSFEGERGSYEGHSPTSSSMIFPIPVTQFPAVDGFNSSSQELFVTHPATSQSGMVIPKENPVFTYTVSNSSPQNRALSSHDGNSPTTSFALSNTSQVQSDLDESAISVDEQLKNLEKELAKQKQYKTKAETSYYAQQYKARHNNGSDSEDLQNDFQSYKPRTRTDKRTRQTSSQSKPPGQSSLNDHKAKKRAERYKTKYGVTAQDLAAVGTKTTRFDTEIASLTQRIAALKTQAPRK